MLGTAFSWLRAYEAVAGFVLLGGLVPGVEHVEVVEAVRLPCAFSRGDSQRQVGVGHPVSHRHEHPRDIYGVRLWAGFGSRLHDVVCRGRVGLTIPARRAYVADI